MQVPAPNRPQRSPVPYAGVLQPHVTTDTPCPSCHYRRLSVNGHTVLSWTRCDRASAPRIANDLVAEQLLTPPGPDLPLEAPQNGSSSSPGSPPLHSRAV